MQWLEKKNYQEIHLYDNSIINTSSTTIFNQITNQLICAPQQDGSQTNHWKCSQMGNQIAYAGKLLKRIRGISVIYIQSTFFGQKKLFSWLLPGYKRVNWCFDVG